MTSPAKPWETASNDTAATTQAEYNTSTPPARPSTSYNTSQITNSYPYTQHSPYTTSRYSSPYSRYGAGGYGGYTSGYGTGYGYSGGYGGYGSYGTGYGGGYYGANRQMQPPQLQDEYMSAFQVLEQVVNSFGGLASLMDSTLMAVHSSFMAMVGLAEHYSHLKQIFTDFLSVFSIFSLLSRFKNKSNSSEDFSSSFNNQITERPKYSKKPIVVFILVFFGLPMMLARIVRHFRSRNPPGLPPNSPTVDGNSVKFAKALYDFTAQSPEEISFKRGDLLAVISAPASEWWRGKLRHGNVGYFPSNYVQIIEKNDGKSEIVDEKAKDFPLASEE